MSVLPTLRVGDVLDSYYVDTPYFSYSRWLQNNPGGLGDISGLDTTPTVAVVGAGVSGLCTAYELAKVGFNVDIYEATDRIGGRTYSFPFDDANIIELGAMRFPPSEFVLNYYLEKFNIAPDGLAALENFPDPGVFNTYVCYGYDTPQIWQQDSSDCPAGFETVFNGWNALVSDGLYQKNGDGIVVRILTAPATITALMQCDAGTTNTESAIEDWQAWLDVFGQTSFYSGLFQIFTGANAYQIPGSTPWTQDDFDRFATLGVGSGGFGPLYSQGFCEIMRIVINQLETTQKLVPQGIGALAEAFQTAFSTEGLKGVTLKTGTPVASVINPNLIVNPKLPLPLSFKLYGADDVQLGGIYDRVVMAVPARSMELRTNVTNFDDSARYLLDEDVKSALKYTHTLSSNKIAARIKKFWSSNTTSDPAVRTLLCNSATLQVYTIDYGDDESAVCFISYTWEDDAIKQQALGMSAADDSLAKADKALVYKALLRVLKGLGSEISAWADNLVPLNGDYETNVQMIEWQRQPYTMGAFKLAYPGQDNYVQRLYFDYQKVTSENDFDTGVYLASDGMDWNAGWVEGAFHPALNAVAATIQSLGGTVYTYTTGLQALVSPLTLNSELYNYFSPTAAK